MATGLGARLTVVGHPVSASVPGPEAPDVARLPNGGFVVVWSDRRSTGLDDVFARVYDANGVPVGPDFNVDTFAGTQRFPSVTATATGFFVVFEELSTTRLVNGSHHILGRAFDALGQPLGPSVQISTEQRPTNGFPDIAVLTNGNLLVTWTHGSSFTPTGPDQSGTAVKAQLITPTGVKIGSEFLVNTSTNGNQQSQSVSPLSDGGFVVVFENGPSGAISAQRFTAAGAKSGPELLIADSPTEGRIEPAVAGLSNGGFAVVYTGGTAGVDSLRLQLVAANGVLSPEIVLASGGGDYRTPSIDALPNGDFVVAWRRGASSDFIEGQQFTSTGQRVGGVFVVNSPDDPKLDNDPAIASLGDGRFVVVWDQESTFTSAQDEALFAQLFSAVGVGPAPEISLAFTNVLRTSPNSAALDLSARLAGGELTLAQAFGIVVDLADATTSVATMAYQFFTGGTPSAGGLDFLVAPSGPNPNNLNSAYYQSFNLENRYINFAVNLGKIGEGRAAFEAEYGALTLSQATKKAYGEIFGREPTDAKVAALLAGGRDLYFAAYGQDGLNGIGTKAAMVGWLLAEAEKADLGQYARANEAYLTDLADGGPYAVDLVGQYGKPEYDFLG